MADFTYIHIEDDDAQRNLTLTHESDFFYSSHSHHLSLDFDTEFPPSDHHHYIESPIQIHPLEDDTVLELGPIAFDVDADNIQQRIDESEDAGLNPTELSFEENIDECMTELSFDICEYDADGFERYRVSGNEVEFSGFGPDWLEDAAEELMHGDDVEPSTLLHWDSLANEDSEWEEGYQRDVFSMESDDEEEGYQRDVFSMESDDEEEGLGLGFVAQEEVDGRTDAEEASGLIFDVEAEEEVAVLAEEDEISEDVESFLSLLDIEPDDYYIPTDEYYDHLFENFVEDGNVSMARPPASRTVVASLPDVVMTRDDVEKKNAFCAVCKDEFGVGERTKQLPCSHRYHGCCILPWLGIQNTCPVCRHELPTDDANYESRKARIAGRSI